MPRFLVQTLLAVGAYAGIALALAVVVPPPAFQANPDAKFHGPPKPLPAGAVTSDWKSFLGPSHDMVSPETKLLGEFSPRGPKLVWEARKGTGYAAPVIAGERLILFHRIGGDEVVECLNAADGRRAWRFKYPSRYRDRYGFNNGPRCSPAIADNAVVTYGAEGKLLCLGLADGRLRWQREVLTEFKLSQQFFGVGATPLIEGERVIVNVGAAGRCVMAFDLRTGKTVWTAGDKWGASYAAPTPATIHGRRRVLVFAGGESDPPNGGLLCLDPASGKVDFAFPWRGERVESVNASAPVVVGNRVLVSECYGAGGALVEVAESGSARLVWKNPNFGTHFMSAVQQDGYFYGVDGHGPQDADLVCVDAKTGKEQWRTQPEWTETVATPTGKREMNFGIFRAWLLRVDGRTLCLGEYGHLLWLDLNPRGYRELARTTLFTAPETWTPPVLSRGLLYICQNDDDPLHNSPRRLLCYDLRAGK